MHHYRLLLSLLILWTAHAIGAAPALVKDGKPAAEIVMAAEAVPAIRLAAEDLQLYVEKISGAKLPIVHQPTDAYPLQIYVGQSSYTDELGISVADLDHGAFHYKSGETWLLLIGRDRPFDPPVPMPRTSSDFPRVYAEWDKLTGETFGYPFNQLWKEDNRALKIWERDERGTYNAVVHFLRELGVRWYMPTELGEVVPTLKTIALPAVDTTVRPDFPVRVPLQWARRFSHPWMTRDETLWQWRMGWNHASDVIGYGFSAHGIDDVTKREEVKAAHPDWFALYGGKRETDFRHGGKPCLSSEGLFQANLRYARAVYDHLGSPLVSVMPADAYTGLCQCAKCEGKSTPDRGYRGLLSDYVWDYVNRIATELYKTHPNHKVLADAYGTYSLPPLNIDTFSPNVVIRFSEHRSFFHDPQARAAVVAIREAFLAKLPGDAPRLIINDKYRSGNHLPAFFPRAAAEDLQALKGRSLGDMLEVFRGVRGDNSELPTLHLNLYTTSRYLWDADQDFDTFFDDYCTRFYGPGSDAMKTFISYAEANWKEIKTDVARIDQLFTLIRAAQATVDPSSVYGQRIAMIADFIQPLTDLRDKLTRGRENAPLAEMMPLRGDTLTLDGKLDEEIWGGWPAYSLRDLETGRKPVFGTRFKFLWDERSNSIWLGITCHEDNTDTLNISTTQVGDTNIWNGDCVEILLETLSHTYYQIAVNPAGAYVDVDREDGIELLWDSHAKIKTHIGDNAWTVEMQLPLAGDNQAEDLPLDGISGTMPSRLYPWFFNVCRARVRDTGKDASAFSPTGKQSFHALDTFGKLILRDPVRPE